MSEKLIMFHGFDQDEVLGLMRLLKANIAEPRKVAFCMTTENNLEWKIRDLISDVVEEHEYMLKREEERAAKREAEE
ncbi:hypothetical protein B4O97_14290 [Marispirochaeta aestuarii]|uniref:DUF3783 domain-containing protein n=1 Tax=Marispirochaeta aestuarii TaxID=1963862 RepID=A0A1Y1RVK2_9SPIO|nr:DUF3783 domain-containing protein [Marispirochaeta aestuarii]ORC34051.1 hypothetical protein B4O97_14290 [Marispirochaeta aestuarii]